MPARHSVMQAIFLSFGLLGPSSATASEPRLNPKLLALAPNRWLKLHEQAPADPVRFQRQEHGGACFSAVLGSRRAKPRWLATSAGQRGFWIALSGRRNAG